MRTPAFVIGLAAVGAAATVNAAALLQWDFGTSPGNTATFAATTVDATMQGSTLSRGAGFSSLAKPGLNQTWGSFTTDSSANVTTLAQARTSNHYFEFTAAPQAGGKMSLSGISFVAWQQNAHPAATIEVLYSTDSFATSASAGSVTNIPAASTGSNFNVALNGISALQDVTQPVTFRLYCYGFGQWETRGLGQVNGPNVDLGLTGVVPEPASLAVLGAAGTLLLGRRRK